MDVLHSRRPSQKITQSLDSALDVCNAAAKAEVPMLVAVVSVAKEVIPRLELITEQFMIRDDLVFEFDLSPNELSAIAECFRETDGDKLYQKLLTAIPIVLSGQFAWWLVRAYKTKAPDSESFAALVSELFGDPDFLDKVPYDFVVPKQQLLFRSSIFVCFVTWFLLGKDHTNQALEECLAKAMFELGGRLL